ncbi:MAG: WYL domain-containing protein [Roseibium sp.]
MIGYAELCEAIKNRQVVSFTYEHRVRTVEPHLVGYDGDGDLTLSAWQLSGGSGVGWRDFHVSKLTGLATTGQTLPKRATGLQSKGRNFEPGGVPPVAPPQSQAIGHRAGPECKAQDDQ